MQSGFDINRLRKEAQTRWLKPSEVLYILQNHEKYSLTDQPPKQPPSGSLFLFNRRVLRFFRKDGHLWRKKKDGRTIGEAHERLKVGSVDALNCYYAHGEQNPYFQRRSYWMLDPAYEHIVLVHYREVAEGRFISGSISNLSTESCSTFCQNSSMNSAQLHGFASRSSELYEPYQDSCSPASVEEVSSKFGTNNLNVVNKSRDCDPSQLPGVNQALKRLAEQLSLDDDDDLNHFGEKLPPHSIENGGPDDQGSIEHEVRDSEQESPQNHLGLSDYRDHYKVEDAADQEGYSNIQFLDISGNDRRQPSHSVCGHGIERKDSPSWKDMLELSSDSTENANVRTSNLLALDGVQAQKLAWNQPDCNGHGAENNHNGSQNPGSDLCLQLSATRRFLLGSDNTLESPFSVSHVPEIERPLYYNPDTSILEANSGLLMPRRENNTEWMGSMQLAVDNNTYSSDFSGMWFDQSLLENSLAAEPGLTVAQKQRFSIREVSPEWAFSLESTKVIITGDFLCNPSECQWAIMFGDIEVPLEIVQEGVLRCQTPIHGAGRVALCVTSGNRESCSQLREFEFRANPTGSGSIDTSPQAGANKSEEILLLDRFAHILLCENDNLLTPRGNVGAEIEPSRKFRMTDDQWGQFIKVFHRGGQNPSVTVERIMQELLKDKLQQWLLSKHQKSRNEGSDCLLSRKEQGVIHMISGLGYEWALGPILSSGVGINFRDISGWTALHWAAHFGREKMVAALLAAGASAGAVTDPTSHDPAGKNAASIAAAHGHKGLAGYLSEAALTSHLSSLTLEESEISKGSAALEAERAVDIVCQMSFQIPVGGTEDQLSLKDYLEAVRNTALAAARIQAAFRAHSFRKRQQKAALSQDEYGMTPDDIHGLSAASKSFRAFHGFHDQKSDKAAVSIQKKYRGWKGRKDFLTLRQNVVKIQAHFRGHQVRKNYKELLWTVSILEKAILRWRRKGVGLRGYRAEPESMDEEENDDIVKVFRKTKVDAALDEALSRVLSMVDSPDARQQYRRMLERYRQAKAKVSNVDETTSRFQGDLELNENDDLGTYQFT